MRLDLAAFYRDERKAWGRAAGLKARFDREDAGITWTFSRTDQPLTVRHGLLAPARAYDPLG